MRAQPGIKIWMQLLTTIAVALLLVWIGVIVWQGQIGRRSAIEQAKDYSLSMHDATMAGLTGMMVTGTVAERHVFLDQIKELPSVRDLSVWRAPAVSDTFGPGNVTTVAKPDDHEVKVMTSGEGQYYVDRDAHGEYLRAIRPAIASTNYLGKNCLTCHQVPEKTVLGVVSMKVSLDKVNEELASQQRMSILIALLTAIPVLGLIYPFITRVVTHPLEEGVKTAKDIAAGDLTGTISVNSRNEIGELQQALLDMKNSLARTVGLVRIGTDTIYGASSDIASGNSNLSERTEQQAASLERTSSSMQALTASVNQNAHHARSASEMAVSATQVAKRAGVAVSEVVSTMDAINQSSRRITDIVGVIDSIAFQTNILALNAAVEAARAGDQGRGFAVVASEVRSLAQRSAAAAKEIKSLINESVERTRNGSDLVHQAGSTMETVVDSIHQVSTTIGEIARSATDQTEGITRVNEAIAAMNDVTQQNAALVEEAAAAAQSLQIQAGHLEQLVRTFKVAPSAS